MKNYIPDDELKKLLEECGVGLYSDKILKLLNDKMICNIPLKKKRLAQIVIPRIVNDCDIDMIIRHLKLIKIAIKTILIFLSSAAVAQDLPKEGGMVKYSAIVSVDSALSAKQLMTNAEKWFVNYYKSAKDVIQYKSESEIIGKGSFNCIWKYSAMQYSNVTVYHTVKVSLKDGRYKYEITDFTLKYSPALYETTTSEVPLESFMQVYDGKKSVESLYGQIDANVRSVVATLDIELKKQDDGW